MLLTSILCEVNGGATTTDAAQNASDAAQGGGGSSFMTFAMWGIIILLFVWMFILQPRKQQKKRQEQINQLVKGAKVITNSGIYGRIKEIRDKAFVIEIADGVKITVDKTCVYPLSEQDAAVMDQPSK